MRTTDLIIMKDSNTKYKGKHGTVTVFKNKKKKDLIFGIIRDNVLCHRRVHILDELFGDKKMSKKWIVAYVLKVNENYYQTGELRYDVDVTEEDIKRGRKNATKKNS